MVYGSMSCSSCSSSDAVYVMPYSTASSLGLMGSSLLATFSQSAVVGANSSFSVASATPNQPSPSSLPLWCKQLNRHSLPNRHQFYKQTVLGLLVWLIVLSPHPWLHAHLVVFAARLWACKLWHCRPWVLVFHPNYLWPSYLHLQVGLPLFFNRDVVPHKCPLGS